MCASEGLRTCLECFCFFATISQLSEKLQDTENEAMSKIVELEKQLMQRNKELDVVRVSVLAAATQMGIGSSCRLVQCGACSFQRNELMQCIYCNHFRGDTQMYT